MFNIDDIQITDWVLLAVFASLFLYQFYFYVRYMAGVQRRVRHKKYGLFRWKKPVEEQPEKGVTVVVCAKNEGDNLQDYLQMLLTQDYPAYEVIVVNDASEDNTQQVLEYYVQRYSNLRLSFVPHHAWVRSSKKLAITLAAKSAKYDYLLLTDADCVPESNQWIREMMHGFDNPETEVVIGYGGYFCENTLVCRRIQYDTIFNAMQYLGMAMSRHPYMGVGRNLAYRKDTFFNTGGFSTMLNMRAGDDDLFVNKVSNRHNTEVVVTPGSFTWSIPKRTFEEWRIQKYRHLSVSPAYRLSTKLRLGFEPLTRGLFYATYLAIIVLVAMQMAHPLLLIAATALFLTRWIWQMVMITRAAHIFGVNGFGISVLWYDIVLPIGNLFMLLRHAFRRKQEQKW